MRPLVVVATALALGCGPSFHAIYEGNARFEHCYALEENPAIGMKERAECWRDWSERYTYGQTRDRIQYATARYVALTEAPGIPTDEALMMAAPGMTPRVSTISAPAPTNPYAPPPKVLDEADASAPPERPSEKTLILGPADAGVPPSTSSPPERAAAPGSATVGPPGSACAAACGEGFSVCDAGARCQTTYKGCMRACFR